LDRPSLLSRKGKYIMENPNTFREKMVTFNRVAGDTLAVLLILGMGYAALVVF
jgi:hypothetical protein